MFTNKLANVCTQNHMAPIIGTDSMCIGADFPNLFLSNKIMLLIRYEFLLNIEMYIIGADSMHIGANFPNLFLSNERGT